MGRIFSVPLLIWMLSPHFPLRGPNGEQELFVSIFFILVSISDGVTKEALLTFEWVQITAT